MDGAICDQQAFMSTIGSIVKRHKGKWIGIYFSCLRRAIETALVVMDACRIVFENINLESYPMNKEVKVVPFIREETWKVIGKYADRMNHCSQEILSELRCDK